MSKSDRMSIELLRRIIRVDPETGRLYWLQRDVDIFPGTGLGGRTAEAARWNTNWAGREALTAPHQGYRRGPIFGRQYYAHHIVWALTHGRWPDEIDHDNRDRADNRPNNLIERSHAANMQNQALRRNNRSGVSGVCWNIRRRKWTARISAAGVRLYIGAFDTFEEAAAARKDAERKYGYHVNHGS